MTKSKIEKTKKLRKQAEKLLGQAEKLENKRAMRIGRLVMKYEDKNFNGFDVETFKAEVAKF